MPSALPLSSLFPQRPLALFARIAFTVALVVLRWKERRHCRRALARLDARLLRDIGLSQAEAASEVAKPFWRA
ncbi:MAG: DUF1127 domain-containing protein [Pseudorhodobacter sp.]|nr:DUF1127 domain-containing protein [Pseudorhodobacter sp.]